MPFTAYHFGPSGFVGLVFRKWIDLPVFVLANVVVDIEVLVIGLLGPGWPVHRYAHTLLIGTAVGIIWAVATYPLRNFFKWIMQIFRIPYQGSFIKMIVSGVLGVWFHVVVDAIYHRDVRIFWPSNAKPLYGLVNKPQVKIICVACFFAALIIYSLAVISFVRQNRKKEQTQDGT